MTGTGMSWSLILASPAFSRSTFSATNRKPRQWRRRCRRRSLTGLKDFGFDTSLNKIRVQTNCHTKGLVIDGEIVLVGSQNWTRAGTTLNRDASLIFFDPEIAKYYENLFLFDWDRIAQVRIDESIPAAALVRPDEGVPAPGRLRVSAQELLGD